MPFSELSEPQRKAASDLFGAEKWEDSMPRRSYGHPDSVVLLFQPRVWSQLSKDEQAAAKLLDMSEGFWNDTLAPFHDELWVVPGVTLTNREFSSVLRTLRKMSHSSSLTKKALAHFLFGLERLLLPSQGVAVIEALKASPSWEFLLGSNHDDVKLGPSCNFDVNLLVACFLSDPEKFLSFRLNLKVVFWDDGFGGCIWGNAHGRTDIDANKKTYATALTDLLARRLAGTILSGSTPEQPKDSSSPLSPLPNHIVKHILDQVLGITTGPIDPFGVSWLCSYNVPLTRFFAP